MYEQSRKRRRFSPNVKPLYLIYKTKMQCNLYYLHFASKSQSPKSCANPTTITRLYFIVIIKNTRTITDPMYRNGSSTCLWANILLSKSERTLSFMINLVLITVNCIYFLAPTLLSSSANTSPYILHTSGPRGQHSINSSTQWEIWSIVLLAYTKLLICLMKAKKKLGGVNLNMRTS